MKYELWWNKEEYSYTCIPEDSEQRVWLTEGAELKIIFDADSLEEAFKLKDRFIENDLRD